ncbi:MAG: leucine-rich repeat protein, partial [Ruminococcus sp.]|nr:leucine-rich repeat protein [Ruminococcus sp.]
KYIYGRIVSTEETVVIPEKVNGYPVTAIGFSAFTNATIKKIALPETIEYIEADAFYNCQFLEEINFPENLKYIGNSAFWYTNLKDIKINCPELIIGRASFAQVSPVTAEINAKSIGELAFSACNNLENLKLGNDIEEIKSNAFTNIKCTDIVLPENLKYLGTEAFYRDSKPKKITIPKSVEIIGTLPLSHGSDNLSIGYIPPLNSLLQEYECVAPNGSIVSGYYDTEAHSYALAHNLKFNPLDDVISGDANDDGKVSIADMVSLSQHILNSRDVSWGADLTKDGRIDSFDMVLMREMILNK